MREIIVLDLQKSADEFTYTVRLRGRRGDARSLQRTFQITDGGEPLDLSSRSVTFMAYTAGGDPIMETVETQDTSGQFTYAFPTAIVSVEGESSMAYFRVEDSDEGWVGSTNNMSIEVLGDVALTDDVTGAYVPMLDQILEASEELAMNASSIMSEATEAINACNAAAVDATDAATEARNVAANAATAMRALIEDFINGFAVEYSDLTEDCKAQIAQSGSSGVELVTQEEIDAAFEETLLPAIQSGGKGIASLTEQDYEWALNEIFG